VISDAIVVRERGRELAFSFDDLVRYNGGDSPGGVAHGYKVLERALALLEPDGPPERRELALTTAFPGPGARDAFELVTRAVTDGRYRIDASLARPELGRARERFVFRVAYRGRAVMLTLRHGFVGDEFIELTRRRNRSPRDEARLAAMKEQMAAEVMSSKAREVYDARADADADAEAYDAEP
jgi:hypothetical protein